MFQMSVGTLNSKAMAIVVVLLCGCSSERPASKLKEAFTGQDLQFFFPAETGAVVTQVGALPATGRLDPAPWNGHYWPSYRGGLLHRPFNDRKSPIEKFEAAFRADLIAANPNYYFGKLANLEKKRVAGITTYWFGICDGESEAALVFPEPMETKKINGIVFYPHDIKALLGYFTAMSDPSRKLIFAGKKAYTSAVAFDPDGRPTDPVYRDTNPGLFHLALTNYLGLRHRGLVAAAVPSGMTLNFPIAAYTVESSVIITDPTELAALKKFNPHAASINKITTAVTYADSHRVLENVDGVDQTFTVQYTYNLEIDAAGNVIGGEWLGDSIKNHPDFIWTSVTGTIDVRALRTNRLATSLAVGTAMAHLLTAPSDAGAGLAVRALSQNVKNFEAYHIFDGLEFPPVSAGVKGLLSTGN
jgi:Transglutaminase elicitor